MTKLIYILYRIGLLPWYRDNIMTYTNWRMHSTVTDFAKAFITYTTVLMLSFTNVFVVLAVYALFIIIAKWRKRV
jgi:hypothetical protein